MTRSWTVTLTNITKTYYLWDLISATIADLTFSNSPFVPSKVQELTISNQTVSSTLTVNSTPVIVGATGTSNIVFRSMLDAIDLKQQTLTTNVNPLVVGINIVAN